MLDKTRSVIDDTLRLVGLYTLLAGIGGAAVLTAIQGYWPQYGLLAVVAVVGFVGVLLSVMVVRVLRFMRDRSAAPIDAASRIRDWADRVAESVTTLRELPVPAYFGFRLNMAGKISVVVLRPKPEGDDHYLFIGGSLRIAMKHRERLRAMEMRRRTELLVSLRGEVSRLNLSWGGFTDDPETFIIQQQIPLDSITEYQFSTTVRQVQNTLILLRELFQLGIGVIGEPSAPAAPVVAIPDSGDSQT
jgi:hypothetical protein